MVGDTNQSANDGTTPNRTRRRFIQAAGATGVVAFAGCTGSDGGGGSEGSGGEGGNADTAGAKAGSQGTKTLRVINSAYEPVQKAYSNLFDEFENQHDNVRVEYNRVGFAEAPQKAAQAHAAGNPYDVMSLASPGNNVTAAQKGLMQPINDVIADRGGTDYWNDKALFKLEGDHYFAPNFGSVLNLLYREDLFEQAGAPMPPFDNWEQYKQAAKVLTKPDQNQYGHPVFLGNNHFHGVWPMMLILMNNGHLVNENDEIVYDSQETAEALAFIDEMDQFSPQSAHNSSIPNMRPPLYQGQYAMTWYSSNLLPDDIATYNPDLQGKVHVAPVPATKGVEPVARMTGTGFGVSSETQYPKLAKELVKFLTSRDAVVRQLLAQPAAQVPMVKGVLDSDKLWESQTLTTYEDHYRNLVSISQDYGRIIAVEENPGYINPVTGRALSETHVVQSVQDVVLNDMEPMQAANKWAEQMREDFQ